MAARKTTTKKSTKSAPKGKRAAQPQPEELGPILSRPVWGAIWGIVGLLCLLSILPIDGVLLKWLHRGIGALIGKGAYVMPFALIGIAVLLFARPKGPVRLRGTCIALMPLLIGSIIHAFSCANAYDLSMSTLSGLLSTGMEGSSGGLLGGGLYILLEWALSSIGALLILLVLFIVSLLVACRITPQALYDMVRPPEYEYEDEEERERYEAPLQLPNIHEAAAAHAQRREERRAHRKSDFDIPIDTDPPGEDKPGEELIDPRKRKGKAIAPDEYLRSLRDNVKKKAGSIMDLVENKQPEEESAHVSEPEPEHEAAPAPASKSKKTENISETEQEAMNIAIDESQKAPMPVYDYPPIDLLTQGKHASVAGAEAELRESSACLLDTLDSFNIEAQIIGIVRGPSVTRFELTIPRGIKISRITALSDDIALSLGAANVRIAPIPDKVAVGIEVPNKTVNTVFIRECIGSPAFANAKSRLSFAVGKDITGKPVIGVVPYGHFDIDDEDSLSERLDTKAVPALVNIAVVKLPRLSNFTDFSALSRVSGVSVAYADKPAQLAGADLIILPGTKSTLADLRWLRESGMEAQILKAHAAGTPVFGICGGYQMMGRTVSDPDNTEGGGSLRGMNLLPIDTVFRPSKTTTQTRGTLLEIDGVLSDLSGLAVEGYEIHMGETVRDASAKPLVRLLRREGEIEDGCQTENAFGTYLHGVFDAPEAALRTAQALAQKKGVTLTDKALDTHAYKEQQYDKLADSVRKSLDMEWIYCIMEGKA